MQEQGKAGIRACKRCLTREMNADGYFQSLHDYIAGIEEELKADEELYEERLSVCKECDMLLSGMCRVCGCYVELRAVMRKNNCPGHKW